MSAGMLAQWHGEALYFASADDVGGLAPRPSDGGRPVRGAPWTGRAVSRSTVCGKCGAASGRASVEVIEVMSEIHIKFDDAHTIDLDIRILIFFTVLPVVLPVK